MARLLRNLALMVSSLFILCIMLEVSLRVYHNLKKGAHLFARLDSTISDLQLGWKGKEIMGDIASKRYKIFFVGDSFTQPYGIGTENMYYYRIKEKLGTEIFVYGGAGYGTLQEYLVIDKYIDRIKPDLVVLQVTHNDFFDNRHELGSGFLAMVGTYFRPYYNNGRIEYLPPKSFFLLRYLQPYSYLVNAILVRMDRLFLEPSYLAVMDRVQKIGTRSAEFKESVSVTSELLDKIKKRCGSIPLVVFMVNDDEPFIANFRLICKDRGIDFLDDVPTLVRANEMKGIKCWLKGNPHWNEEGHRVCAERLADYIAGRKSLVKGNDRT